MSGIFSVYKNESNASSLRLPNKFIACVTSPESSSRIKSNLDQYNQPLQILQNDNLSGVQQADIVILGCKPLKAIEVVKEPGVREALKGKLLISICGGVTALALQTALYGNDKTPTPEQEKCRIVRVMPNTNAVIRRSMTVIQTSEPPLSDDHAQLVAWIFHQVGEVTYLTAEHMDAATAFCGSGPAFIAYLLESLMEGGKAIGLPADKVQFMAANVMAGTVVRTLGKDAKDPADLRREVVVPNGCTHAGIEKMKCLPSDKGVAAMGALEATIVEGVVAARDRASELGQPGIGH